jgi:cold shock CspA family protein/cytidylate kinase
MDNIIAIYGPTCSLKTEVAQELSIMTGFKLTNRGEKATTEAKFTRKSTAAELPIEFHRALDNETREMARWNEKLMIFESAFMDAVLAGMGNVYLIRLHAADPVRNERWKVRKEEGGGRTRQIGESVAARDREDAALRLALYGSATSASKPVLDIDTTKLTAVDVAKQIWDSFQAEAHLEVVTNKPPMDKAAARGIFPGATTGLVTRFNAKTTPFGGYLRDDKSGQEIYMHKSAATDIESGDLAPGMKVAFEIVADSFGGFKAVKLRAL